MSEHDGGPAFPQHGYSPTHSVSGLSLRDWFAGQVIGGIANAMFLSPELAAGMKKKGSEVAAARMAFEIADAMLAERA